jgi:hypothetical protein
VESNHETTAMLITFPKNTLKQDPFLRKGSTFFYFEDLVESEKINLVILE